MKILVTGIMTEEALNLLKTNFDVEYAPGLSGENLKTSLKDSAGIIIRTETLVSRELLENAPKLKVVCRSGVGLDNVDLEACVARKIVVMNTPTSNVVSAAEHTLGLILSLARMIPQATQSLKAGHWNREKFTGIELQNKTLGIIGFGNIGSRVATRAEAFSMKILACDPYIKSIRELVTSEKLLAKSDFVSIHVPLSQETKGMANSKFFERMKAGSFFINTSRGKVCVEADLVATIESEHLGGAALDVFETEPLAKTSRLLDFDNVLLTPHIAGQTFEANRNMSLDAATQVRDFFLDNQEI